MKYVMLILAGIMVLTACESESEKRNFRAMNPNLREVTVTEVLQTPSYTYLKMKEEGDSYWSAISRREDIAEGNTYYFDNFMEMKNFKSKELDKTFESIYFIEVLDDKPFPAGGMLEQQTQGAPKIGDLEIEIIAPVEGSTSVGELYRNKDSYAGNTVKVIGKVVKFTPAVMNKNWVHIQDGSQYQDNYDLTITTDGICQVGDVVVFEGKLLLDQDFGYGYVYEILLDDSKLLQSEEATSLQ